MSAPPPSRRPVVTTAVKGIVPSKISIHKHQDSLRRRLQDACNEENGFSRPWRREGETALRPQPALKVTRRKGLLGSWDLLGSAGRSVCLAGALCVSVCVCVYLSVYLSVCPVELLCGTERLGFAGYACVSFLSFFL